MDLIVYAPGATSPAYLDISIVSALSQEALAAGSATKDGKAAEIAARGKRRDYRLINVTPFILEDHGRFGEDAVKFLKSVAPVEPRLRSKAMQELYHRLSSLLQRHAADAVLAAITVRRARSAVVIRGAPESQPTAPPLPIVGSPAARDMRLIHG
jgi:hypothetical protein